MFEPILTPRLRLRRLEVSDAARVQLLAGDPQVAATTLAIPHPYPDGAAEQFIALTHEWMEDRQGFALAMVRQTDDQLVGVVSLTGVHAIHRRAELGYWVGVPYWGQGYATEASEAVLRMGFEQLDLNSVFARFFTSNPASGRVMQKVGMTYEGTLRQHYFKNGAFVDLGHYTILRSEWEGRRG